MQCSWEKVPIKYVMSVSWVRRVLGIRVILVMNAAREVHNFLLYLVKDAGANSLRSIQNLFITQHWPLDPGEFAAQISTE